MRVLHVISTPGPGGAGHQLRLLVRRLPHDNEVVMLAPAASRVPGKLEDRPGTEPAADGIADALRAEGARVHRLTATCDRDPGAIARLRRLMLDGRYDVVHTHLYRASVQGRIAARLAGVPHVVTTEHHLGAEVLEGRRVSPGVRALYLAGERLGQVTIAASPAIAGRLRDWGVPDERIAMIPKAIDPTEFRFDRRTRAITRARLGVEPGVPLVGGVGRLEPDKRFDLLIRAIAEVPDACLLLVGDGPARASLERLAVIEGVADRVLFAGAVVHTREMLCAMDVFASPDSRTFGLAILEAIASGLPAVYAACPPLEERITARAAVHGTHRLSPRDRESLPRALRAELLCLDERGGARLPGRSVSSRYDADHLAAAVGRLYERIADRPRRRQVIAPLLAYRGRARRFPLPGGKVRNA
ncbi:glycosyltransferase involved in cell wall biosynthesis [Actinoplanes lutulentus]|uniref:Glycosyltransferase involved in cell wall biosynthesis n=1 Tax=Actinoplanes lutulentus TaxID=1287878 RepID=A0A327ZH41_9ACTN|nr:glycosyltransferase [Actinoplanes lutulentus]MBB2944531.1 glycosyltransferase involved in cell wall biosynthesis [Actinoplanes lutulentus]RAK42237.1 glycosyltransferase involved in cell wall biosynthesis [Actinoplanes lutulentus]